MFRHLAIVCLLTSLFWTAVVSATSAMAQDASQKATLSPSKPTGKVAEVEAYSKEIDEYVKQNEQAARIYADVSSGKTDESGKWRQFKNDKEREAADTGENLNENAHVWTRNGKIVGANFTFQSPSRDWSHFVMYYFRPDGTLAKSASRLNTFYGDITVIRDDYYDTKGRLLKGTTYCQDLKTQRRKACGEYQDRPPPFYKTVSQLPFYILLKK